MKKTLIALVVLAGFSACDTPTEQALVGGLGGAAVGAAVGDGTGAAVGAVVGAVGTVAYCDANPEKC